MIQSSQQKRNEMIVAAANQIESKIGSGKLVEFYQFIQRWKGFGRFNTEFGDKTAKNWTEIEWSKIGLEVVVNFGLIFLVKLPKKIRSKNWEWVDQLPKMQPKLSENE